MTGVAPSHCDDQEERRGEAGPLPAMPRGESRVSLSVRGTLGLARALKDVGGGDRRADGVCAPRAELTRAPMSSNGEDDCADSDDRADPRAKPESRPVDEHVDEDDFEGGEDNRP